MPKKRRPAGYKTSVIAQESEFKKKTSAGMSALKKRSEAGELSFTLEQLRAWVRPALLQPCRYCKTVLQCSEMSFDHIVPLKSGGSSNLKNVQAICSACNKLKGSMSHACFVSLMELAKTFDHGSRTDMFTRMKAGGALIRLRFIGRKKVA